MAVDFEKWVKLCDEDNFLEWSLRTIHRNKNIRGKGFNKFDTPFAETLVYKVLNKVPLSANEKKGLKSIMQKYFKQLLCEVAEGNAHWDSLSKKK